MSPHEKEISFKKGSRQNMSFYRLPKRLKMSSRGRPAPGSKKLHQRQIGGGKKLINRKHINVFLTALAGQSSQGRTPTHPRDKRDKMEVLLWKQTGNGRFVPGTGPNSSQGGVPFVPGTLPVCPRHLRPKMFMLIGFFFLPEQKLKKS